MNGLLPGRLVGRAIGWRYQHDDVRRRSGIWVFEDRLQERDLVVLGGQLRMVKPRGNELSDQHIAGWTYGDATDPGADSHRMDAHLASEVCDGEPGLLELADKVVDLGLGPMPPARVMGCNGRHPPWLPRGERNQEPCGSTNAYVQIAPSGRANVSRK